MQIKETIGVSLAGSIESPPLENVVLVDSAGVVIGVRRAFSAKVRVVQYGGNGLDGSRCVEIPLLGSDGEVSGILCHTGSQSDTLGAVVAGGRDTERAMAEAAQFFVHDINNLFAVIGSGLRLLEGQGDASSRKVVVAKMQEAVARGVLLSRQLLGAVRPNSIGGFVAGTRLAEMAGTLDQALHPDVTVRSEIASDLWTFDADPEELYFALLNLCRNSADAMPDGGVITLSARNVGSVILPGFVEIVVADDGAPGRRAFSPAAALRTTRSPREMRADIVPGGVFPDYELTDHTRTRRRLSDLQGRDPLVLILSRGHFCPKDHQQHLQLAAHWSEFAVAYTQVATIATDNLFELNEFRASVGAQWTFLSDVGRKVQQDLEIQEYTDPTHNPMIPHTFVLRPGLVIHSVYNGYWYWGRPSVEDLRRDLREVTRDIRPDWDPTLPDLRAAWEAGDHSRHFPYR